jgi:hypothetical protein
MSSRPSCPELVRGAFWRVLTKSVTTTFALDERNKAFMERNGEVYTQPSSAPTSTRELWAAIQTAWLNISPDVSHPLVESMLHFAGL